MAPENNVYKNSKLVKYEEINYKMLTNYSLSKLKPGNVAMLLKYFHSGRNEEK